MGASNPSRQARRWLHTDSPVWKRIRQRILSRDPICTACARKPSTVVDHENGRADRREDYRDDNLRGMCAECHSLKTAIEDGSFGRAPGAAAPQGCDEHGTPRDPAHHWRTR